MKFRFFLSGAIAFFFQTISLAQVISPPPSGPAQTVVQQTLTTGMLGFTANQTARLNVLNITALPSAAGTPVTPSCTVELQFFDDKGNMLKQTTVSVLASGTATSLDLPRASVTSATTSARAQIRGVVIVNPTTTPGTTTPVAISYCSVATTLEIYDSTGSTVAITSDMHPLTPFIAVPVAVGLGR